MHVTAVVLRGTAMPETRPATEMPREELLVIARGTRHKLMLLQHGLDERERRCTHDFVERHVSGPRDNNDDREYRCSKCGLTC